MRNAKRSSQKRVQSEMSHAYMDTCARTQVKHNQSRKNITCRELQGVASRRPATLHDPTQADPTMQPSSLPKEMMDIDKPAPVMYFVSDEIGRTKNQCQNTVKSSGPIICLWTRAHGGAESLDQRSPGPMRAEPQPVSELITCTDELRTSELLDQHRVHQTESVG